MKFRLSVVVASVALCVSTMAVAYEAPVVDVQQNSVNAQPDNSSNASGDGWQTVSNNNNNNETAPAQQQWVSSSSSNNTSSNADSNHYAAPAPSGSVDQRVSRLEQQMANLTQMNLPQQVSDLQQKLAQVQGQLEVDQRELKTLTKQQKIYYQDVEQQITQLQQTSPVGSTASVTSAPQSKTKAVRREKVKQDNTTTTVAAPGGNGAYTATGNETTTADNSDTTDNATAQPKAVLIPTMSDADTYDHAFQQLSRKRFGEAKTAFTQYLQEYPRGHFAVNAHFWLGELALMNQHYDDAANQFNTVVKQYPHSNKVPDARLKIAMIHAAQGRTDAAKKEFASIQKDYPGTTDAQMASIRLQQISGGMTSQ